MKGKEDLGKQRKKRSAVKRSTSKLLEESRGDTPAAWRPTTGPLVPQERFAQIDAAISLLIAPGEPGHNRYLRAARCIVPEVIHITTIIEDAFDGLQGDIDALDRFTTALELIGTDHLGGAIQSRQPGIRPAPARRTTSGHARTRLAADATDLAVFERWHSMLGEVVHALPEQQRIIPEERLAPVLLAAAYAGLREPGGEDRYLGILNNQLCGIRKLDMVWNSAQAALGGDQRSLSQFQMVLEQVGAECGLDDSPLVGWQRPQPQPQPCPIPWPPQPDTNPFDVIPGYELKRVFCMLEARLAVARSRWPQMSLDSYIISAITPLTACAGQTITITGSGFGNQPAKVRFPIGGMSADVTADVWTSTHIEVKVPPDATCGNIALVIPIGAVITCGARFDLTKLGSGATYFDGSAARIRSFTANGKSGALRVDPGTAVNFAWSVCPTSNTNVRLTVRDVQRGVVLADVPGLPANGTYSLSIYNYIVTTTLECTLAATGACKPSLVEATITLHIAKIPVLKIEGIEVTQGIQTFWRQNVTWNTISAVANKDTIVRVYISADMGGFNNDEVGRVTGTLDVGGVTLHPINGITPDKPWNGNPFITARKASNIKREQTDHTLNFRIPAYLAYGTKSLFAYVIVPGPGGTVQTLSQLISWTWEIENALPVRWVRIRDNRAQPAGTGTIPTDDQCRYAVERAFDLLPTPATDIAPAFWYPTHDTSRNFVATIDSQGNEIDEGPNLRQDIDNLHQNAEWLTAFIGLGTDTNTKWIGLTVPWFRGWGAPNTCIAPVYTQSSGTGRERNRAAHELGHVLGLCHLHESACSSVDHTLDDVAFDPYWNQTFTGSGHDFMSYTTPDSNWITGHNWNILRNTI